jgi:hypothetical protein
MNMNVNVIVHMTMDANVGMAVDVGDMDYQIRELVHNFRGLSSSAFKLIDERATKGLAL